MSPRRHYGLRIIQMNGPYFQERRCFCWFVQLNHGPCTQPHFPARPRAVERTKGQTGGTEMVTAQPRLEGKVLQVFSNHQELIREKVPPSSWNNASLELLSLTSSSALPESLFSILEHDTHTDLINISGKMDWAPQKCCFPQASFTMRSKK